MVGWIILSFILGFALGFTAHFHPRIIRQFKRRPLAPKVDGRLTCVLYDSTRINVHSRISITAPAYPPVMYRPHGKTAPSRYIFMGELDGVGEYAEAK